MIFSLSLGQTREKASRAVPRIGVWAPIRKASAHYRHARSPPAPRTHKRATEMGVGRFRSGWGQPVLSVSRSLPLIPAGSPSPSRWRFGEGARRAHAPRSFRLRRTRAHDSGCPSRSLVAGRRCGGEAAPPRAEKVSILALLSDHRGTTQVTPSLRAPS